MRNKSWPTVLIFCGLILTIVFVAVIKFAHLSSSATVMASVVASLGCGIAAVGVGGRISQSRRGN